MRLPLLPAFVLTLCLAVPTVQADVVTVRSGLGTVWQRDRDTSKNTRYAALLTELSYRSGSVELSLDMPLRWESQKWELDRQVWSREGDPLRPVETLLYRSPTGHWETGLELLQSWTPGRGYLVRSLSGGGEVDYALPAFRFRWEGDRTRIEAGVDRPIDPSVQAIAVSYRPFHRFVLHFEGARDPAAPLAFTGTFQNGRPVADDTDTVAGRAAGLELLLLESRTLDISLGAHTGKLGDEADGSGSDLSVSIDFSSYYRSRLQLKIASIQCRGGYMPAWFDGIYPVQRWGNDGSSPLLVLYPLDGTGPDRRLDSMEIRYDLGDLFSIRGGVERFDDDSMSKARFDLGLREESGRGLEATVTSRVDGPDGKLFAADSNLYTRVSALYDLSPHILLRVAYEHSWAFHEETPGVGALVPVNSAMLGVMYGISF